MGVYKNENGVGYRVVLSIENKVRTFRKDPRNGQKLIKKKQAKDLDDFLSKNRNQQMDITFAELFSMYKEEYLMLNDEESSSYDIVSRYNNHIFPVLKKKKVIKMSNQDLNEIIRRMKMRNLSVKYINTVVRQVVTTLRWGYAVGIINTLPIPTYKALKENRISTDLKYLNLVQINKLIEAVPIVYSKSNEKMISTILKFAFLTGLRVSEIRALKFNQIDFDKRIIFVDYHFTKQGIRARGRKAGNAYTVVMDDLVYELLVDWKNYLSNFNGFNLNCYVFPTLRGCSMDVPLGRDTPNRWISVLGQYCGFQANFHMLRHSACSYWASLGLSPAVCAKKLGDSVTVTTTTYADIFMSELQNASNHINENNEELKKILKINK